jgi:PTH1 family peptidyl-tRNA hydrolase
MIRMLVGLGNPGPEYEHTRHNAGFWWLDAAARKLRATLVPERSYFGLAARVNRPEGPVWLLAPMTYMNLSGKSVAALARFYKIEPQEILVAHDELDLQPGHVKLKLGGSATANGVKDICAQLGSADFWRLRLGIGHPGDKSQVIDYVLQRAKPAEENAIVDSIDAGLEALSVFLRDGAEKAMHRLHSSARATDDGKAISG